MTMSSSPNGPTSEVIWTVALAPLGTPPDPLVTRALNRSPTLLELTQIRRPAASDRSVPAGTVTNDGSGSGSGTASAVVVLAGSSGAAEATSVGVEVVSVG